MKFVQFRFFFLVSLCYSVAAHASDDRLVSFDFLDADLVTVINTMAKRQKINILFPQGVDAITQKITTHFSYKIPLKKAFEYLDTYLELAGYARTIYDDGFKIVKVAASARESLPLYINVPPKNLPSCDQRIRAIYYLANLQIPVSLQTQDPIAIILQDMLSNNKNIIFDQKSNAVILEDTAFAISAAMHIILELDASGIAPAIETVMLRYTSAETIAQLLKTQILVMKGPLQTLGYFNASTRVIADSRLNSIILMGRAPALNRIKDFLQEIDVPEDSGQSLLHVYSLEYLDAAKFAPILQRITSEHGEKKQATQEKGAGSERFFEGVIVVPESVQAEAASKSTEGSILKGTVYQGGNNLIIAARNQDWPRIVALIKQLDQPEPQVIIEMLVVDLDVTKNNLFSGQMRNPSGFNLPPGVNFQVPNITGVVFPGTSTPATLANDIFAINPGNVGFPQNQNQLIISFNDPAGTGIWGVLDIIDLYNATKVLSRPHMVLLNHKKGETTVSSIRRAAGGAEFGLGSARVSKQVDIEAALDVAITAHISATDEATLQVSLSVDRFTNATDVADVSRFTRKMTTNVHTRNGEILVFGGLIEDNGTAQTIGTPLLSKIPILGRLLRSDHVIIEKTSLVVFIAATVVEPKKRESVTLHARDHLKTTMQINNEHTIFSGLKDPITQLFFNAPFPEEQALLDEYTADSTMQHKLPSGGVKLKMISEKPSVVHSIDSVHALKKLLAQTKLSQFSEEGELVSNTLQSLQLPPTQLPVEKTVLEELVEFDFKDIELTKIINDFAQKQKINILLPQGIDAIAQKITFSLPYKITWQQAEKFLNTFLEIAGYSKVPYDHGFKVIKLTSNITREILPLFVDTPPDKLPHSDQRIRVIYYLKNIKVPATPGQHQLTMILEDMLTSNRSYLFDTQSNALIVADTANAISSVMHLILELDSSGTPPAIQVVPVFNTSAYDIVNLIKTQLLIFQKPTMPQEAPCTAGYYFNPTTRLLVDPRTNNIILLGEAAALNRLHGLIDIFDVPADSGDSILHYYDLQFLDATDFAPILQKLVQSPSSGVGQSTQVQKKATVFTGVIVIPEGNKTVIEKVTADNSFANINNRLIITAGHDDWLIIKELLDKLDQPERQVIIESVVVNLETGLLTAFILGSQIRNASGLGLPPGVNFQTTNLYGQAIITDPAIAPAKTLAADLAPEGFAKTFGEGGPFVATLNDPNGSGIWGVLAGDDHIEPLVIISHPYLTTANHKKASIESSDIQRYEIFGTAINSAVTVQFEDQTSSYKLEVTPHINDDDQITLELAADLSEFVARQTFTGQPSQKLRSVKTQARISNGATLAFGGFPQITNTISEYKTPLLSSIPILGWLFKRKGTQPFLSQLIFFLKPTIVEPKKRKGLALFTQDKLKEHADVHLDLDNPNDPITQLFFKPLANKSPELIEEFLSEAEGDFVREKERLKESNSIKAYKLKQSIATAQNPLLQITPKGAL